MELLEVYVNLTFVGIVALFPVVNPPASALMIDPFLQPMALPERKGASRTIALYCFALCVGTALLGSWVFRLFGVSLPVVQLAGGVFICRIGWQQLSDGAEIKEQDEAGAPAATSTNLRARLFYPLAFPMTTGPGTISVLLTLSAHGEHPEPLHYLIGLLAIVSAILFTCATVYVCYAYAPTLLRRLGPQGGQILNRLNAFLVFCVGLQIASAGIEGLFHLPKG